jgi:ankyrin repeat protein
MYAARNCHASVVKLLINEGANPYSKDKLRRTPLLCAIMNGQEAVVKLLLKTCKLALDSKYDFGRTPLWHAAYKGHKAVVELLLANDGVDVESIDDYGRTPLVCATNEGHEAVVRLLGYTGTSPCARNDLILFSASNL